MAYVLASLSVDAAENISSGIFSEAVRIVLSVAVLILFAIGIIMGR